VLERPNKSVPPVPAVDESAVIPAMFNFTPAFVPPGLEQAEKIIATIRSNSVLKEIFMSLSYFS
jgi:hypothetical protein